MPTTPQEGAATMAQAAQARLQQWRRDHPRATLREIEGEVDRQMAGLRTGLVTRVAHQAQDPMRPV